MVSSLSGKVKIINQERVRAVHVHVYWWLQIMHVTSRKIFPGGPRNNCFSGAGGWGGWFEAFFSGVYYVNFDKFEFSKWEGKRIRDLFSRNFNPRPLSISVMWPKGHVYRTHMTNLSWLNPTVIAYIN